jgi:glycyl-tRNA synthetase beta subunit
MTPLENCFFALKSLSSNSRRLRTVRANFSTGSMRERIARLHQASRNLAAQAGARPA